MLRYELTGYEKPVPFNVKSNIATINFKSDENNWGIPGYDTGSAGYWKLKFEVVYPTTTTEVGTESTTTTEQASTFDPASAIYNCSSGCKYLCIYVLKKIKIILSMKNNRNSIGNLQI